MIEENVVSSAGTVHYLSLEEIKDAIRELGYMPRRRNVWYQLLDDVADSPAHHVPAYDAIKVQREAKSHAKQGGEAAVELLPVIQRV